jgi:hypothetical protein
MSTNQHSTFLRNALLVDAAAELWSSGISVIVRRSQHDDRAADGMVVRRQG